MNFLTMDAAASSNSSWILIVYVVIIGAMLYFMILKPQKKQRKEQENLMNTMAIGDSVMTTAGFYGVIIDMTDDTVIVEFGNNKNCRIPMQKQAIVQIEKPADPTAN
ncbi:MAG: preprotein translocase subunit YajC [Lachnospiraceae bacterium]|nr:preprotein translocase subunit YajC [Lachnospiraceae bacterium]